MPWLVPSHQAPVLPLKRWRPRWFSGLGLVLGTVAPDLVFIVGLNGEGSPASHAFAGQLFITVPMVLALHVLATEVVLPWLLPHVTGQPPLYLHALARSRPVRDARGALRVAFSGLLGGLTHVFIDGFTHGNHTGWAVPFLPVLRTIVLPEPVATPLHDVLQVVLTIVLGAAALGEWSRYARNLPAAAPGAAAVWEVRPAPLEARRAVQRVLLAAFLVGALAGPAVRGAYGTWDALELAAFGAIDGACFAAVGLACAHRVRRAIAGWRIEARGAFGA
jgi:hypothetical protein